MIRRVVCRDGRDVCDAQKIELVLDGSVCVGGLDHESHRLTVGIVAKGGRCVDRAHRSRAKVKIFQVTTQVTMRRHCPVNVDSKAERHEL